MDNPATFLPKIDMLYLVSRFREYFSLLAAMLCKLFGLSNSIVFKAEWALIAHHILTTRESFIWAKLLLVILNEAIEKYQKTPSSRKPTFYLSSYVMDVLCAAFDTHPWDGIGPGLDLMSIFIIQHCGRTISFLLSMTFVIILLVLYIIFFKEDAPTFSDRAKALISTMGD